MRLFPEGRLVLSASDLTEHLACAHLSGERRGMALGTRPYPRPHHDPHAELIRERGDAHEAIQLLALAAAAGGDVADLRNGDGGRPSAADLRDAAAATVAAMRAGVRLVFQATLIGERWQGRADFLRRVEVPSDLGGFSYEVLDTKLARHLSPYMVHQLCLYSRLVGEIQGAEPTFAHVITGDGTEHTVGLSRYAALHRRAAARLERFVDADPVPSYPEPTDHCAICRLGAECRGRWRADDHLAFVAGARRDQRAKLAQAGLSTLASLADAGAAEVGGLAPERLATLHHQARLQRNAREGRDPVRRQLEPAADRGYARLPPPSQGDVFFDFEGDPYVADGGLEYLWGWSTAEGYECLWAHDAGAERRALERFLAVIEERRVRYPDLHVFHYGAVEASTLRTLALRYATGEAVVDDWLRRGLLVDLYAVVRQGLQVGEESYGLKALERHHGFARLEKRVREGGGSIVAYETWLKTRAPELLEAIRAYNREDCESTRSLRDWLWGGMRPEAAAEHGVDFAALTPEPVAPPEPPQWLAEVEELIERLCAGLAEPSLDGPAEAERRLLADLLLYHYRESKPQWWGWFDLRGKTPEELVEEREAVGLVELDAGTSPTPAKKSLDWTYRFPDQEAKLEPGDVVDPATGETHNLVRIDDGELVLRRGKSRPAPTPGALIGSAPPDARPLRQAIRAVAESVLAGERRFPGARAILRRDPPRLSSGRLGAELPTLIDAGLGLDGSYLAVQGPPGTGKTYNGARMIVAAIRAGRRVALTAQSHAAIKNMLRAVEHHAGEEGFSFRGVYKGHGYVSAHGLVEQVEGNRETYDPEFTLVAGTAWLLACDQHAEAFDLLFVDEAGQLALASTVAAGRCARSLVLLGDPQQLPQVNQASHPGGSGASTLGHLLCGEDVVRPDRGVLLDTTWRMHPEVCRFASERSYAGLLQARPACGRRRVDAPGTLSGAGLRAIEVGHEGRSQDAPEEAAAIAAACRELLAGGATVTDDQGRTRELVADDVLVVAPYNLAVARIRREVPDGVRVGTVDRFQGQEAPVVFFALTCSSGDDVPRGLDFLFDRNRLNVAVSRAQCLAVLVHSPRLLDADCRTLEQMELLDGLCRLVELAEAVTPPRALGASRA